MIKCTSLAPAAFIFQLRRPSEDKCVHQGLHCVNKVRTVKLHEAHSVSFKDCGAEV